MSDLVASHEPVVATVVAFDVHVGLGAVRLADGSEVPFHCAEIADGSRRIDVGTRVSCTVRPKFGRLEAFSLISP